MRKVLIAGLFVLCGFPATAEPVVIAALGDSLTQGYGLPQGQGFVPQMQEWLDKQGVDVELVNAGVSGDTTAGGAARVAWTLTPEVDAMIVTLGGNDMLRGIDPAAVRQNLTTILTAARDADVQVLLVGMQAPGNYGPEYKAEFDKAYVELADEFGVLRAESFFQGFPVNDDPAAVQQWMQADGIHPNPEGVTLIVEGLGPQVLELAKTAN
ncbi:arylesterase [Tropicibacter sp. R16_0]|uniref:arylesterase n=1 Tax=Tropicibacter sp. R16_0 TaxID=2821102 RepID=UPI001ADAEFBB|nr:arylesterase [Tropicibacter sp. R16_0]MBO9450861.1 arylesterase [Tropicibacter sp. R16_0]